MRFVILLAVIFTSGTFAMADAISITSSDHAQTFAYGEMVSHQLYFNQVAGELIVQITFSNQPYADSNDPPSEESFSFRFPGIRFDSAQRIFFARSQHDKWIPVAQFGKGLACGRVDLAPGAKTYLVKDSGRVTATLTATNYPRAGTRWVQADDNFSLQNILAGLFGEFFPDSEN
ncbi:MAG: hypothetical protein ACM3KL_05510 [Alphaproteobacteria bacterium]